MMDAYERAEERIGRDYDAGLLTREQYDEEMRYLRKAQISRWFWATLRTIAAALQKESESEDEGTGRLRV